METEVAGSRTVECNFGRGWDPPRTVMPKDEEEEDEEEDDDEECE